MLPYKVRLETGFLTLTGPVMLASGYGVVGLRTTGLEKLWLIKLRLGH